tara:strand:+ start:147 stop:1127 length:981 start_codon:yes stop_codon:yes gene_type:complete
MAYLFDREIYSPKKRRRPRAGLAGLTNIHSAEVVDDGCRDYAALSADTFSEAPLWHMTFGATAGLLDTFVHDEDCLVMFILTGGTAAVRHKGREIDLSPEVGLIRDPRLPLVVRQEDFTSFVVPLSISSMKRHASALFGKNFGEMDIAFAPSLDMTSPEGQHLRQTVFYIADALDGPLREAQNPIVLGGLRDLLLTNVLSLLPNSYSELSNCRPSAEVLPYHVKRARDYIHANAADAITLEMLANNARCSHRTLQVAFNEAFGMSPLAYVRFVRLNFVHDDLRLADDQVTVRDVALKWGFTHLGWFSKCYLEQFGILPSQTLRARI